MSDAKYFGNSKKGENAELKLALNSSKKSDKRDAVKKVIASMTIGKDVSPLFADVINCMQTDNLELKKLVYLYLMNYAKSQPDLAIMAVNTFVKDCDDTNPLIRALAVRTMGCIRVDKITEYLCEPLRTCLKDADPYVRKTAAVCVAKLYDIEPSLVEDQGFLESLQELLSDANPMVVANAVAALSEIHDYNPNSGLFDLNPASVSKLLTALNECTEWGQVFILDSLAVYSPKDQREIQNICERVSPRLQHVNAAVVLSAVKVLLRLMESLEDAEVKASLTKKLAPPLVTLLSSEPEVQFVALRNINLIVQKRPEILTDHIKVFFVKYNDPIYVKLEKLDVMIRLVSEANIQQVLAELKEYATEVDVDFVRKSVRAIGRCAIKVEEAAERCVDTLLDLIHTKINYVVQEAIVVIKDIFRKYPNKYESIIGTLCENLDSLDEPDAKTAMIWIVGEYAERIDNAGELLSSFLENFAEEPSQVQLQLLTSIVKLFLKRPSGTQELVQKVLSLSTQETDNPDLRDRGYVYWRLLLTDPAAAKAVVLCDKPLISEETDLLEPSLLDELICHISSLASVYHKPPSAFVEGRVPGRRVLKAGAPPVQLDDAAVERSEDLLGEYAETGKPQSAAPAQGDLLSGIFGGLSVGGAPAQNDFFGAPARAPAQPTKEVWLNTTKGNGLEISGSFSRRKGQIYMDMTFANKAAQPIGEFAIQFNKNSFSLAPSSPLSVPTLSPGGTHSVALPLGTHGGMQKMTPLTRLQVAVKTSVGILYFDCDAPSHVLWHENSKLERADYLRRWKEMGDEFETTSQIAGVQGSTDSIIERLEASNISNIAKRVVNEQELCYLSIKFINEVVALVELTLKGAGNAQIAIKTQVADVVAGVQQSLQRILTTANDSEA